MAYEREGLRAGHKFISYDLYNLDALHKMLLFPNLDDLAVFQPMRKDCL